MSFLIDDEGNIIGTQKMVHVAQCEQFYEQSYYTPSEEGFSVFDTKIGKIGIVTGVNRWSDDFCWIANIVEMEAIPSATGESPAADGIFFAIAY